MLNILLKVGLGGGKLCCEKDFAFSGAHMHGLTCSITLTHTYLYRQHTCAAAQDVWQLSLAQADDILHLRRLVLTRRAVLAEERAAIISQLALTSGQMQNSKMEDVIVVKLTEALLKVSAEHRQALCTQTRAWGHGVRPSHWHLLGFIFGSYAHICTYWASLLALMYTLTVAGLHLWLLCTPGHLLGFVVGSYVHIGSCWPLLLAPMHTLKSLAVLMEPSALLKDQHHHHAQVC